MHDEAIVSKMYACKNEALRPRTCCSTTATIGWHTEINFYLKGRMSSFLKSKYHYSFLISASERPVIRCIKSTEQLSLCISFAVSRFA